MTAPPEERNSEPELARRSSIQGGELALRIRGLSKSFGHLTALSELDLEVRRGECLGLLGPNGAGKSTTIRISSTLLKRDAGEVQVLGLDPRTDADEVRQRIGVVPQEVALYDDLSARENLNFFGKLYGLNQVELKRASDEALHWSGLEARAKDRVKGFSGGMKRRLNLALAFLHQPELVFLDEPTVGIDPQSRYRVFEMVEHLRARGITLVYASHQMDEVQRLCDRIAILDRGRRIAVGTMEELRGLPPVSGLGEARLALKNKADVERVRELLKAQGIDCEAAIHGAGLEQIFLALTGRALRDGGTESPEEPQALAVSGNRESKQ